MEPPIYVLPGTLYLLAKDPFHDVTMRPVKRPLFQILIVPDVCHRPCHPSHVYRYLEGPPPRTGARPEGDAITRVGICGLRPAFEHAPSQGASLFFMH